MFDTFRSARLKAVAAAGLVGVATMIGSGVSVAETPKAKVTEVSLKNELKVTVEVKFTGAEALQKDSWNSVEDKTQVIGNAPDGTTIKWEAKPKHEGDKKQFTLCKGEKKVSGPKTTIVMSPDSCTNAAGKAGTAANNKTPGKSAGGDGGTMTITFENTTSDQSVDLRIWDSATTGVTDEICCIAAAGLKSAGVKNTSSTTVKTDKSGKYTIEINWHCRNNEGKGYSHGGTEKYYDSSSTIRIEKTSDGGCELKNIAKLVKKP